MSGARASAPASAPAHLDTIRHDPPRGLERGPATPVVVAGLGNEFRRDDAVGPLVAEQSAAAVPWVHDVGPLADPLDLLGRWDGAELAVIIDAVVSGAPPGTVSVLELPLGRVTGDGAGNVVGVEGVGRCTSTHGIGLVRVVHLARLLGQAPRRVAVVGIEGRDFGRGTGLSPAVAAAVPEAMRRIVELTREVATCV